MAANGTENPPSTPPRILVAGIGNIFLGDDAFGVEVVQRLARRPLPPGLRVVDFGIRGIDLTYALLDDYDLVILVDAMPRGEAPGTLFVIDPDPVPAQPDFPPGGMFIEGHNLDPAKVLALVAALGGKIRQLRIVGCQPEPFDEQEMRDGLSAPVRRAVDEAIAMVESLIAAAGTDHARQTLILTDHVQSKGADHVTLG